MLINWITNHHINKTNSCWTSIYWWTKTLFRAVCCLKQSRKTPEFPAQIENCTRRNWEALFMCSTIRVSTRKFSHNSKSRILEHELLLHDRLAACGIAQQYFSTTFVSLDFYSHKDNRGAFRKHCSFTIYLF